MYFRTPSSILVAGPSGSGKTVFVSKLLKHPKKYFKGLPSQKIVYCYMVWQPLFTTLQKQGVHFHQGIPTTKDLTTWFGKTGGLMVLDDLMEEGSNDKQVLNLFTRESHHRHITVLYLIQDLFPPGNRTRNLFSKEAHYVIQSSFSTRQIC